MEMLIVHGLGTVRVWHCTFPLFCVLLKVLVSAQTSEPPFEVPRDIDVVCSRLLNADVDHRLPGMAALQRRKFLADGIYVRWNIHGAAFNLSPGAFSSICRVARGAHRR